MNWINAPIHDVIIQEKPVYSDHRGWLSELYRTDDLITIYPEMAYLSCTKPGTSRGPHEHATQTDHFFFISGTWGVKLWDPRPSTPNYLHQFVVRTPTLVTVPPGVIHAYANMGLHSALVLNLPNQLYKGLRKTTPVDEIRHEDNPNYPLHSITLNLLQRLLLTIP